MMDPTSAPRLKDLEVSKSRHISTQDMQSEIVQQRLRRHLDNWLYSIRFCGQFWHGRSEKENMAEGSLDVKLPTIWTDEKQREQGRGREKRKIRRERVRRKKMQIRGEVGKSRNTVFFQWFVAPEGRKVGSLKRRVWSQLARWEMKNCKPSWREAHFEVKMYKTPQCRTTFGSWDVEKVHAVVARSTFRSQK